MFLSSAYLKSWFKQIGGKEKVNDVLRHRYQRMCVLLQCFIVSWLSTECLSYEEGRNSTAARELCSVVKLAERLIEQTLKANLLYVTIFHFWNLFNHVKLHWSKSTRNIWNPLWHLNQPWVCWKWPGRRSADWMAHSIKFIDIYLWCNIKTL